MVSQADLVVIGVCVGLGIGILIATLFYCGMKWYRKRACLQQSVNEPSLTTLPIRMNGVGTSTDFSDSIAFKGPDDVQQGVHGFLPGHYNRDQIASASGLPRYSYKDIEKATRHFTTVLGEGSFGPVYKATMPSGEVVVVKVLASNSKQGEKEFQTELFLLARLYHRNLVNLVGYCADKGQHMLIYEFMKNGSLESFLYNIGTEVKYWKDLSTDEDGPDLSWQERLQIALDIAHGIKYLHEGAVPPVIHRDLKSANILLDETRRAKVADFGLSKEEVFDGRNSGLKGTYGYMDPAYISTNQFTMKSDIYSFGVIIFELITAIHPHQNLMEYVNLASMSPDGVDEILDKRLVGNCNSDEARTLARIANKCLHSVPKKWPSIGEVLQAISRMKQRRLAKDDSMSSMSNFSRAASRIEYQQVELSRMVSVKE